MAYSVICEAVPSARVRCGHAPHSYSQPGVFGSKICSLFCTQSGPISRRIQSRSLLFPREQCLPPVMEESRPPPGCLLRVPISRQRTFQRMSVQVVNLSVRTIKMRSPNAVLRCEKFIRLCQRFFSRSAPGQPPPPAQVGKSAPKQKITRSRDGAGGPHYGSKNPHATPHTGAQCSHAARLRLSILCAHFPK